MATNYIPSFDESEVEPDDTPIQNTEQYIDPLSEPDAPAFNEGEAPEVQPETETPSQEIGTAPLKGPGNMTPEEIAAKQERLSTPGGFLKETLSDTGKGLVKDVERASAIPLGILDTVTDFINMASADGGKYDIPKVPEYEDKATQALRNISGLIMPMLGIKGAVTRQAVKLQKLGAGPKWLQSLGQRKGFEWFAKFGLDAGSGALVDYVAEQNQKDDNFLGSLKKYWPQTYSFIPYTIATGDHHSADQKRDRNVKEGAIFSMMASVLEGVAFLTEAGRSMNRTAKLVPSTEGGVKNLKALTEDEFTNIVFDADNPIADNMLRNYARKEKALNDIGEYYLRKGEITEPTVGLHDVFDESETLVRTKDADGVAGAMANAAEVRYNKGQYGRLGTIVSEASRKNGLELPNLSRKTLVSDIAKQIKKVGKFKKVGPSGVTTVSEKMIDDAVNHLTATLLHPRVSPKEILGILDEFKRSVDDSVLRIVGKKGISKAIKQLREQITDLDFHKARAVLTTSEAGQIADFSEGARLMEDSPESFMRTVDLMADRLEVLMVEKGLAKFEADAMLQNMNSWKEATKTGDKRIINQTADIILDRSNDKLTEIIPKAKAYTQTLKDVARENPEFLKPLMLANEFTDGNVDSLYKLHQDAGQRLAVFKKAIVDKNPEVPAIINKAWFSNLFNSTLSAFGTPIKAATGNLTGLIGKGSATIIGAVAEGDLYRTKKAMTAWYVLDDTLGRSLDHMRLVFRKAASNPKEFAYITRGDIAIKETKSLNFLRAYAEAAEANNEYGASALLHVFEDLEDMSLDPMLRFGGNSMTGLDGFAKSIIANVEAKYAAIDELHRLGKPINDANMREVSDKVYKTFFDQNDMISDKTINAITSEIALNADSKTVDGINALVQHVPASRPFLMFPKTTANVIDTFRKWSPAGVFSEDYQKLWGPVGRKSMDDFTYDEIVEIMTSKGRDIGPSTVEDFTMLRYEVKGKAAIGSFFTTLAFMAGMNDRCTGNGHWDKARQRARVKAGWKPKTCKVPGTNKRVSYEWMGPIGDWLSLAVDVTDNFDLLSTSQVEYFGQKLMFVLGSAFFNRTNLVQLEPLHDVLQGNGAAATRFMSSFLNNTLPMGNARAELGRLLNPQLRELKTELHDALRNRNGWLDLVDPQSALPGQVDYIDGKKIGYQENWFVRAVNVFSPIKIHDQPSPERQFLIDIEYNSSPNLKISQGGAILENNEITAIHSEMGKQGIFKAELQDIMRDAENITYTGSDGVTYKGFVNILKAQRRGNVSSEVLDSTKFQGIFNRISTAYDQAKALAENSIDVEMQTAIREREYQKKIQEDHTTYGNLDGLYEEAYPETLNLIK